MIYVNTKHKNLKTKAPVDIVTLDNGCKMISDLTPVVPYPHATDGGNDKTGDNVQSLSTSPGQTCDRSAPCWKTGNCYACGGCFNFFSNVLMYAETTKAALTLTAEEFAACVVAQIKTTTTMFRWFVAGDIPSEKTLRAMVLVAEALPHVRFWGYTKKYRICNRWVETHGGCIEKALPRNLHILFSEWEDEEFRMDNPYGFPVARFIPLGKEGLLKPTCTYICPCSDPNWSKTCEECGICADILPGEVMGLCEHSTNATAERDAMVHASQKRLRRIHKIIINIDMGKKFTPISTIDGRIVAMREVRKPIVTVDGRLVAC